MGDLGSVPGLGRSPGEGTGSPLQNSGLENPVDYVVHGVTRSRTRLSDFDFTSHITGALRRKETEAGKNTETGGTSFLNVIWDLSMAALRLRTHRVAPEPRVRSLGAKAGSETLSRAAPRSGVWFRETQRGCGRRRARGRLGATLPASGAPPGRAVQSSLALRS